MNKYLKFKFKIKLKWKIREDQTNMPIYQGPKQKDLYTKITSVNNYLKSYKWIKYQKLRQTKHEIAEKGILKAVVEQYAIIQPQRLQIIQLIHKLPEIRLFNIKIICKILNL